MSESNQSALQKAAASQAGNQGDLAMLLTSQRERISELSAGVLTPERLTQLAILATRKIPALQRCSVGSIVMACMDAARLGLEPDGVQGAVIPYKGEAAFQPMYRGLLALAYREGSVDSVEVRIAFDCDQFEIDLGTSPRIMHRPSMARTASSKPLAYYAVAHMRGVSTFDVMLPHEVDAIRKRSPSFGKSSSPWDTDYDEMAKKTVIKRLLKKLPGSARLRDAISHDNEIDSVVVEKPQRAEIESPTNRLLAEAKKDEEKEKEKEKTADPPDEFDDVADDQAADLAMLDAHLRATPKPIDGDDIKARKAPLIAHAVKAKSINDAAFRVAVLVARHRLGDVTMVPAERAILDVALARIGGFTDG